MCRKKEKGLKYYLLLYLKEVFIITKKNKRYTVIDNYTGKTTDVGTGTYIFGTACTIVGSCLAGLFIAREARRATNAILEITAREQGKTIHGPAKDFEEFEEVEEVEVC